ncbi:MAG: hypothetical protein IJA94_00175 [Bacilli bacterium]|nr:hypothetical protein [Bacilli bacterium]
MRNVVDDLFPGVSDDSYIKCWKNHYKQKSDIFIRINGVMRGISIKKGSRNSVHVESVYSFINFLKENGLNGDSIKEFLKYHYADGTINGSGEKRMAIDQYKLKHQDKINVLNEIFNSKYFINSAIERFVIKGTNSEFFIDGIIYGEVTDFLWINRKDIIKVILAKQQLYSSGLHFGSLFCQPKNRCLNCNKKYEQDRHIVQIKWYSLFDDIIDNMNTNASADLYKKEYNADNVGS